MMQSQESKLCLFIGSLNKVFTDEYNKKPLSYLK